ncbi:hypothetical protein AAVH_16470 [Aphelenchoides avenae]|nr:hypothetical protein AAVH_16470 [Aphelenchus avenae]
MAQNQATLRSLAEYNRVAATSSYARRASPSPNVTNVYLVRDINPGFYAGLVPKDSDHSGIQDNHGSKTPTDAVRWIFERTKGLVISDFYVNGIALTHEVVQIFHENQPLVKGTLQLIDLPTFAGGLLEDFIDSFLAINSVNIKESDTNRITDDLLRRFVKKSVGSVYLPYDLVCSSVSEDGILHFCFSSPRMDHLIGARELRLCGPVLSKDFFKRLIQANERCDYHSRTSLRIYGLAEEVISSQDTSAYQDHKKELHDDDSCYEFHGPMRFIIVLSPKHGAIEMHRADEADCEFFDQWRICEEEK